MSKLLTLSPSPHIKDDQSIPKIMYGVVLAMVPALIVSFIYFGAGAIKVAFVAILSCLIFEYLIQKFIMKAPTTIADGSAVITGMLLAFNVPSNLPSWMVVSGSLVAIGIAKMSFGGLGKNPFNPALVGRVFMLISFPVHMTTWPLPKLMNFSSFDSVSGATALGILKGGIGQGLSVSTIMAKMPSYYDMFLGNMGGSLGEVSALALLIGGGYMLYKKIITWHIPVSFIMTVILFTGILWLSNDQKFVDPLFHILTGGLLLGALFMATDMVTSPMTGMGMIVFGVGCGLLTVIIRQFGAYPEGVSFAILIMNAFTPIINNLCRPRIYGARK